MNFPEEENINYMDFLAFTDKKKQKCKNLIYFYFI